MTEDEGEDEVEDEGKETVQDTTQSDEKRDMFNKIREMTFESEPAAYIFYNAYAKDNGFTVRKDIVRYSKGKDRHMRLRRFLCGKEGLRDRRLLTEEGRSRRLRPESRCNCEAHLTVNLDKKDGVWRVSSFQDSHKIGRASCRERV